jgi:hypothetical protein
MPESPESKGSCEKSNEVPIINQKEMELNRSG